MPSCLPHRRILASAGSGKTWQLATRYLQLIHGGAEPGAILASTFTRLAAGEIRDRILLRLAEACNDDAERAKLAEHLGADSLTRDDALALLTRLARRIHRMNIRTLDSFFAAIVRAFPFEIGLPPAAQVVDDDEAREIRIEAIRRMLDEHDPQSLVETLRLLTRGNSTRSVMGAIETTVDDLYARWLEADDAAWECLPLLPGELDHVSLVDALHRFETLPEIDELKPFGRTHAADAGRARSRDWPAFLSTGIAAKLAQGEREFNRRPIPAELVEHYRPVLDHAMATVVNRYHHQTIAIRDLLNRFHVQLEGVKRERAVLTFRDLTTALDRADSGQVALGSLDDLCWRIDHRLDHVLLDEFQDTSVPQWRALEPNLRELVSDETTGRSFFCVGDLKQAIYEWRDASPEILEHVPSLLFGEGGDDALPPEPLPISWRSAQPVIDAVNHIFGALETNAALDEHRDTAQAWSAAFDEHEIAPKNRNLSGYVEVRTVRPDESGDYAAARIGATIDLVTSLLEKSAGRISIGILTRKNEMSSRILAELQHRRISASGAGGGALTDAAAVNVVLDLLQLSQSPDHTIAAFNIACSPVGAVVGLDDFSDADRRRDLAGQIRLRLIESGFGPYLAWLVPKIAADCSPRELRRLLRLVDLAESFDAAGLHDADSFINFVQTRDIRESAPAPVEVMTIHRSKGLEFDCVILPELGASLCRLGDAKVLYQRAGAAGRITRICGYIPEDVRGLIERAGVEIEPMFAMERHRQVRQNLSLLYVAMTRAKQGLYVLLDPPKRNKDGSVNKTDLRTLAGVVWSALTENAPDGDEVIATFGDAEWVEEETKRRRDKEMKSADDSRDMEEIEESEIDRTIDRIALAPAKGVRRRGLAAPPPSAAGYDGAVSGRLDIRIADSELFDRGVALHAMFENIEWIEDGVPSRDDLIRIAKRAAPRRDYAWAEIVADSFLAALNRAGVRNVLSRAGREASRFKVRRELPFVRLTDAGLQQGSIDRLVVEFDEDGRNVRASVIDFKTDSIDSDACAARGEQYRPQLEAYRAAASEILGLDESRIEMIVLFVETGDSVTIAP